MKIFDQISVCSHGQNTDKINIMQGALITTEKLYTVFSSASIGDGGGLS